MTKRLRYKPKKAAIEALRKMREPEFKILVDECVKVLINGGKFVMLSFPYFCKFDEGFPKGFVVERTASNNIYRANARKLLDWLFEKGYTKINSTKLFERKEQFERHLGRFEKSIEEAFNIEGEYNGY